MSRQGTGAGDGAGMTPAPNRRALLSRVHIARKELALAEDSYRAVLHRVTGHDSAAACTEAQLRAAIAEFGRLGWQPKTKRPLSKKPHVRFIWALWGDLRPKLRDGSAQAVRSFVQRQTGVTDPEWLDAPAAKKVIEALKAWQRRVDAAENRKETADATVA